MTKHGGVHSCAKHPHPMRLSLALLTRMALHPVIVIGLASSVVIAGRDQIAAFARGTSLSPDKCGDLRSQPTSASLDALFGCKRSAVAVSIPQAPSGEAPQGCHITVIRRVPLAFGDGRTVHVNAEAVAVDSSTLLITGSPAYIWRTGARADDWRDTTTSIIGVLTDASGRSHPLPSPRRGRAAYAPRAVSAGKRGWHFVFVDTDRAASRPAAISDSAELWYGRFDGSAWQDISRIGVVHHAKVDAALSSDLIAEGEQLTFAFAFDKSTATNSNARGNQGVVLVRGRPGRWRFDTLHTKRGPNYVQLARSPNDGVLHVSIVQPYFDDAHVPRASSLFLSTYDSAWHQPRHIAGDGERPLLDPVIVPIDTGLVLLWRARTVPPRIEWAVVSGDTAEQVTATTVLEGSREFITVRLSSSMVLVLARDGASRDRIRAVIWRDGARIDLGTVMVPNYSYDPRAVAISSSDVLFISSDLAKTEREPPARTFINRLRVTCSGDN